MQEQHESRKTELASHIIQLLDALKLPKTASTLRREANLNNKPDYNADIKKIKDQNGKVQYEKLVIQYWTNCLKRLIREGKEQEALELLEKQVPNYVEDVQPFCLLFAQSSTPPTEDLSKMLERFLGKNYRIPDRRANLWLLQNQIWFLEALGYSMITIDNKSTCRIISQNIVIFNKKLHESPVLCIAVNCQHKFATGDKKGRCKVWNDSLECLYQMTKHSSSLNSLYFDHNLLASFDNTGTIYVTAGVRSEYSNKNSLPHSKLNTVPYTDVKPLLGKGVVLGAANPEKKGRIDLIDLQGRKVSFKLNIEQKIYRLEISACQRIVLANLNTSYIHAYSINKFELLFKISGYVQEQSLMQMSIGGHNKQFLAVTSEEGCVLLYSLKKKQRVGKIKGSSNQPVNCVRWIGSELYLGCDGGRVERWIDGELIQSKQKMSAEEEFFDC